MSIPTAELSIAEITKLQDIFVSSPRPLTLTDFIDAFRSGLRKRVDERLMALLFALIDSDDRGEITWVEFQNHIELIRADTQQNKEKIAAVQQLFEDHVEQQEKQIKELYHTGPILRVYQPDADTIISASADGTVKRWDAGTLQHRNTLHFNTNGAADAFYEESSGLFVIANCDQTISLYDLRQNASKCLRSFLTCRSSIGDEVEVFRREFRYPKPTPPFTFHGRVAPELEGSVLKRYWEAQHSNLLQRVWAYRKFVERYVATAMPMTTSDVTSVSCRGEEGRALLYLGLNSGGLHIYNPKIHLRNDDDVAQAINPVATWQLHKSAINRIVCDAQEEMLITCGSDNDIHMTHLERGITLKTLRGGGTPSAGDGEALTDRCHTRGVKGVAISKAIGSRILASWGLERFAILWDPLVGKPTHTLEGHLAKLVDLVFSPVDDNLIFTYSEDYTTKIWDRRTYRLLQQLRDHPWDVYGPPGCLHYDKERKSLITASHRLYWKHPTNRADEESAAHTLPILSLSCCDNECLLVSCDERSIRIWNLRTLQPMSKWTIANVQNVCVDVTGVSVLVETGAEELKAYHSSNGLSALLLSGTAKPAYLAELSHRYIYWPLGYWVVATAKQLLVYDATTDQKTVMYPTPTYKKELWGLTDRIICMILCDGKLVVALHDGCVNFIVVGKEHPLDPKHQPFVRLDPLPRAFDELPLWRSFLAGPLHPPPRQIIVDANKLRLTRLSNRETFSILDEIPLDRSDKDDRVECMAALSAALIAGSRSAGVLSLWNLASRREVFRFRATSHANVSITALQTTASSSTLLVGDDSGYLSVFDMSIVCAADISEVTEADSEAKADWYARRIRRLRWFRVDVGVVSDVTYCRTLDLVLVSTTTPCLMVVSPEGERIAALGLAWPPNPPTNAAPFETLLRQYRQEILMARAETGSFTAHELVEHVLLHHADIFSDEETVVSLLSDMCPDLPECELERLMEKTAGSVYIPLHAKPMPSNQQEGKRREVPLSAADQVRDIPMVAVWQRATQAFEASKQTKPFTRRIAGHAQLLDDLDSAASAKAKVLPWESDAAGGAEWGGVEGGGVEGDNDATDEVDDMLVEERRIRRSVVEEVTVWLSHTVADAYVAEHRMFADANFQSATGVVASTCALLRSSYVLWRDCVQHEHTGRAAITDSEQRLFEKIRTACLVDATRASQSAARRCGFTAHGFQSVHAKQHAPLHHRKSRNACTTIARRSATPPPQWPRGGKSRHTTRARSGSCGSTTPTVAWRAWGVPFLSSDALSSGVAWHALWTQCIEDIPVRTAESFARKEARMSGILHQFRTHCEELVQGIVFEWSAAAAQQAEYQWLRDGVHLHCVSNPVAAQLAGSMHKAMKAASKELTAQGAFVNAQHHLAIPVHCPLACVVRNVGLVFYCSAVLPLHEGEEVPFSDVSNPAVTVATRQVFDKLHLEEPTQPATIPMGTRRFLSKSSGKVWMIGLRTLFPSQGPQWGDISSASKRLRPEAVAHATGAICASCFSVEVPLVERRRADRDGIKLIRNVSTALVDSVAHELFDLAARGVMPLTGRAVVEVMHKRGVNVFYLSAVAFTTIRLCAAVGVIRRMAPRKSAKSTTGIIRAADEGRRVATADESNAPQRLVKVLFTEIIARTFRHVMDKEMQAIYLRLHQRDQSPRGLQGQTTVARHTSPAALRSVALQLATKRVNDLLMTGSNLSSLQFWNDHMTNGYLSHFLHGEFGDRISADDCDVVMVWHRVEELCGFSIRAENDQFMVDAIVPTSKTIQYHLPFDEVQLLQFGIEFHGVVKRTIRTQLRPLVGPERWWLERYLIRIAVLCQGSSLQCSNSLSTAVARAPQFQSEWVRLETMMIVRQGFFEEATKRLTECLITMQQANAAPTLQAFVLCSLLDIYQWTGQHGQLRRVSEDYLVLAQRAVKSNNRGISFLDLAHAQKTTAKTLLAIPAQVLLHRKARDMLLCRFELLRKHLPCGHELVLEALHDVATSHIEMEEEFEGIEILHRVANLRSQHMGIHHKATCEALECIGEAYTQVGDFERALATFQGTLDRRIKGYPQDAAERTIPHLCMVEMSIRKGDVPCAMQHMNAAASLSGSLPFDSPVMLRKLSLDACLAEQTNDLPAAVVAWTKMLDSFERSVGSLSTQAADALLELGMLLFEQGKYHESWHCFDVSFGIRCKLVSRHHPSVALTMAWLARSEAAAGDRMSGVEAFELALELFDAMCNEDAEGSTFPKLKAQALVDVASLLFKDVEDAHRQGTPLDVKRLMVVGRNHQGELRRAIGYLNQAELLMLPLVMDAHHASIRAMRVLKEACEELTVRVTADEETAMSAAERMKRIETWAKPPTDRPHDQSITSDALWYRRSHKIFKLR